MIELSCDGGCGAGQLLTRDFVQEVPPGWWLIRWTVPLPQMPQADILALAGQGQGMLQADNEVAINMGKGLMAAALAGAEAYAAHAAMGPQPMTIHEATLCPKCAGRIRDTIRSSSIAGEAMVRVPPPGAEVTEGPETATVEG